MKRIEQVRGSFFPVHSLSLASFPSLPLFPVWLFSSFV